MSALECKREIGFAWYPKKGKLELILRRGATEYEPAVELQLELDISSGLTADDWELIMDVAPSCVFMELR